MTIKTHTRQNLHGVQHQRFEIEVAPGRRHHPLHIPLLVRALDLPGLDRRKTHVGRRVPILDDPVRVNAAVVVAVVHRLVVRRDDPVTEGQVRAIVKAEGEPSPPAVFLLAAAQLDIAPLMLKPHVALQVDLRAVEAGLALERHLGRNVVVAKRGGQREWRGVCEKTGHWFFIFLAPRRGGGREKGRAGAMSTGLSFSCPG